MNTRYVLTSALALAVLLSGVPSQAAPVTGAIFTTLSNGSVVNGNQYDSKCTVYLDGGPGPHAPAHAAGLPDGDYYFQVTDPSGKSLLSTDAVSNRRFRVVGGVIVAYFGSGGPTHPTGIDQDHSAQGAVTIRLANSTCPTDFLDTPNNGSAYKVWATPVGAFAGDPSKVDQDCGNGCFHGFLPSQSKTDNFRKSGSATFCLTVQIHNSSGDSGSFDLVDPLGVVNHYFTDASGTSVICGLGEGSYTVTETLAPGDTVVGLIVNGAILPPQTTYSFTWTADQIAPVIVFENEGGGGLPQ